MSNAEDIDDAPRNVEEMNEPVLESEDLEAILGSSNEAAFRRYAIPPQFDGNSSDEEDANLDEQSEVKSNQPEDGVEENGVETEEDAGYVPLVADEFGEFVSSENFGDYYTPDVIPSLRDLAGSDPGRAETKVEEVHTTTSSQARTMNPNVRIGIPPLDADKIQLIKAAMAKVTIRPPNLGAMALADTLERSRLRIGDELTD